MFKQSSEEKIQEWQENIRKQQQSGLSIVAWCRQNNTFPHVFSYWKKKLATPALSRSSFTELTASKGASLFFEYQGIRLYVDPVFDQATLRQCLQALKGVAC